MKIDKIEFFTTSDGTGIAYQINDNLINFDRGNPLVHPLDEMIKKNFPDTYKALCIDYGDDMYMRVLRFIKCNWSMLNNIPDIDNGVMNIEYVPCPMRGECRREKCYCNPVIKAGLSLREIQIVKLIAKGLRDVEIANELSLSLYTAENHRKNILSKLGLRNKAEITRWAMDNNIGS